ncbi:alkaline phosphatase D family protein [Actinorhabdospora filicis]|uniref:alkaline phosphatase D family protein n=1 Tax=Actinorhabdospora filicis TaxID=1785913 RepID=UPI0025578A03|nr:alkaline phosphatase D family protein [Actinorhabdospora filicis]
MRRRNLIRGAAIGTGAVLIGSGAASAGPALHTERPVLTHGVQAGDVDSSGAAVLWTRADRPSRMWAQVATRPDFRHARTFRGPQLTAATDFTGKLRINGLCAGQTVHYRVWAEDERGRSLSATGSLRTPRTGDQDVRFVWSADLAGQGWGINPEFGGFRIFGDMLARDPDFFLCSGDFYYADNPIPESITLADGRVWRNVVTAEKSKVAETLDEFRGQYKYNLADTNLREFLSKVPLINQWDDHEVINNWYPGKVLTDDRYTEKNVDALAANAWKALAEYTPSALTSDGQGRVYRKISYGPHVDVFVTDMRSFRNKNDEDNQPDLASGVFGRAQLDWLKAALTASTATWKVLSLGMPIGGIVSDGKPNQDGVPQGDPGQPLGRELEVAELLTHVHRAGIQNLVVATADVHYTSAQHYDPSRAAYQEFTPFWEFIAGPMNAGSYGPVKFDPTFGPEVRFHKPPKTAGTGPMDGGQFFGEMSVDAETLALTVRLIEIGGTELFQVEIPAS